MKHYAMAIVSAWLIGTLSAFAYGILTWQYLVTLVCIGTLTYAALEIGHRGG